MNSISVKCNCGKKLRIKTEHAGKSRRCDQCQARIRIPGAEVIRRHLGREISLDDLAALGNESIPDTPSQRVTPKTQQVENTPGGLWQPGQLVDDRYQVEKQLGKGGCGIVWKAHHKEWNIDLAVKEYIDDSNTKPKTRERRRKNFIRESQAWVDDIGMHPHVVTAWYVRELHDTPYLFLEYCDGGDLSDWIKQGKTRDLKTALDIAIQLAWGLAHCHEKGIVHRDFKPLNVMMTSDGMAKITDFGMVKFAAIDSTDEETHDESHSIESHQTLGGGLRGTPPYMPPEQWVKEDAQIDQRADIYALGVTIYEILTGELPIRPEQSSIPGWIQAHANVKPARIAQSRDDIPSGLDELVQQCLAKDTGDRPKNAKAVVQSLLQIYEAACGEPFIRPEPRKLQPLADGLNNQGVSLLDLGKQQDAERRFEAAIAIDPQHPEANFNLGLIAWRDGRLTGDEVLAQVYQTHRNNPDNWQAAVLAGFVHLERGEGNAALALIADLEIPQSGQSLVDRVSHIASELIEQTWKVSVLDLLAAEVECISISADGKYALIGHKGHPKGNGPITLVDTLTGQCVHTYEGHRHAVESVAFSADGQHAITAGADKTVYTWNIQSGRHIEKYSWQRWIPRQFRRQVASVAFRQGEPCALSIRGNSLWVWNLQTGEVVQNFLANAEIDTATLSADGQFVFASTLIEFVLWKVEDGLSLWRHRRESIHVAHETVSSIGISPDAKFAIVGINYKQSRLWDLSASQLVRTSSITVGRAVAVSTDGNIVITNNPGGYMRGVGKGPQQPYVLCMPTDVETLSRTALLARELTSQAKQLKMTQPSTAYAAVVEALSLPGYSRNSELLKLRHEAGSQGRISGIVAGWCDRTFEGHTSSITALTFSPDGRYLLSGSDDQSIRLWNIATGECHGADSEHRAPISCLSYAANGSWWISSSIDDVVCFRTAGTGKSIHTFQGRVCAINYDGTLIVTAKNDLVQLWDARTGESSGAPLKGLQNVKELRFSPDGEFVLIRAAAKNSPETVCPWIWRTGTVSARPFWHCDLSNRGSGATLSADGTLMAFGASDEVLVTRVEVDDTEAHSGYQLLRGHSGQVKSVAFATDPRFLVSGSVDYVNHEQDTIRLWDIATGECLHVFHPNGKGVNALAFTPSDRHVASGTDDGIVRLWQLVWDHEF